MLRPELVALVLAAFLGLWLLVALSGASKGVSPWANLAARLGGRLEEKSGNHVVRFPWRGREAVVGEKDGLWFAIDHPGFFVPKLNLMGAPSEGAVPPPPGESVAGCLVVESTPDGLEFAREAAGDALLKLRELSLPGKFKVTMENVVRIQNGRRELTSEAMLHYVRLCLRLAELARVWAERSSGVQVVGAGTVSESECQVCGASLAEDVVRCSSCRTLHHQECWTYLGRCSTYGCGEGRFLRA